MALIKNQYIFNNVYENAADYGTNLLTGDQTDFEGGTTGGWTGSASYTPANTTAQAQAGTHSLQLTSAATGAKTAISPALTVTAGTVYGGYGYVRANTTVRLIQPTISWYSDAGATTLISTTVGGGFYVETNTSWIRVQVAGTAPGTAIRAKINFIWANSANPEVHYLDTVVFATVTANVQTASTLKIEAHGRGGAGGNGSAGFRGGGGGGGAYARTNAFSVLQGQSYSIVIGTNSARDSYFTTTGVAPTSTSEGILAKGGNTGANATIGADGAGGAGGTTAASFGVDAEFAGANGATGTNGGGGAGNANAGSGQTGGAVGGGNGGAAGTNAGQLFGGGGGGGPILSGAGGAGGGGTVLITQDTGDDSVTASDNFTTVTNFIRDIDETATATDANSKSYSKPLSDSVTATDDEAKAYFKKNEDEVLTSGDTVTKVYSKPIAEDITATDDVTVTLVAIREFDEIATATDAIAKSMSTPKADSVTASESSFRHPKPNKSDSVTATDEATFLTDWDRTIADDITAADSIAKNINIAFADNISGSAPPPVSGTVIFAVLD